MKKQGIFVLLLVTCLFCGFVCGFFLGRNLYHGDVHISALPKATTQPDIPTASSDPTVQTDPIQTTAPSSAPGKININTATKQQLMTLPGIGEKIAMSIIEYRETNGPFRSAAELLNVDLIGEKRLEAIIELITF